MPRRATSFAVALLCAVASCGPADRRVSVVLPNAAGVDVGTRVRCSGLEVGNVRAIGPVDSGVLVDMAITRPDAPVRATDRVTVTNLGLFGERVLDIVPGTRPSPSAPPNARLVALVMPARADSLRTQVGLVILWLAAEQMRRDDSARRSAATAPATNP